MTLTGFYGSEGEGPEVNLGWSCRARARVPRGLSMEAEREKVLEGSRSRCGWVCF